MRDTIDMAREADIDWHKHWNDDGSNRLKAFEALVRADEREACAKVCEGVDFKDVQDAVEYADVFAAAIRARGNT